jgi:S-DNA-T family DNA segregation ATPase FtsK/SpoIIIE
MTAVADDQDQMPKPASSNPNQGPSFQGVRHRPNWVAAIILFVLGILLAVAFLDYSPAQSRWITTHPTDKNLVGVFGAGMSYWTLHWIGVSIWLIPLFLIWLGCVALRNARRLALTRLVAMMLCVGSFSGLWSMWESFGVSQYFTQGTGGLLGTLLYNEAFKETLGVFGSALLLGILYGLSLLFIFSKDITTNIENIMSALQAWRERRALIRAEHEALKQEFNEAQALMKADSAKGSRAVTAAYTASKKTTPSPKTKTDEETSGESATSARDRYYTPAPEDPLVEGKVDSIIPLDAAQAEDAAVKSAAKKRAPLPDPVTSATAASSPLSDPKDLAVQAAGKFELNIVKPEEPKKARSFVPPASDADYQFPPLALLVNKRPWHRRTPRRNTAATPKISSASSESLAFRFRSARFMSVRSSLATRWCPRRAYGWRRLQASTRTSPSECGRSRFAFSPLFRARQQSVWKSPISTRLRWACGKSWRARTGERASPGGKSRSHWVRMSRANPSYQI